MANIKIGTFNVRGLREGYKRRKIFQHLYERQFDLICLQETHSEKADEKSWRTEWRGKIHYSHGDRNSRGTAILIRKNAPVTINQVVRDKEGRFIGCEVFHEESHFNLLNIYAPNKDTPEFFLKTFIDIAKLEESTTNDKIMVGDFNLALNLDLDKTGGRYTTNKRSVKVVKGYMEDEALFDIYRMKNPDTKAVTWRRTKPELLLVRLDYMLVSASLIDKCIQVDINAGYLSDHFIPWLIFTPNVTNRGPGFWRLNTSFLKQEEYVNLIKDVITECKKVQQQGRLVKWDWMKQKVKEETIKYASSKKKSNDNKLLLFEKKLKQYSQELIECKNYKEQEESHGDYMLFDEKQILEQIEKIERDRDEIIDYKLEGAKIRARRDWMKFGDKSSRYFYNLEAKNYKRKNRYKINDKQGVVVGVKNVLKIQDEFYESLYNDKVEYKKDNFKKFVNGLESPKLENEERNRLEDEFTRQELKEAIFSSKKGKVPGEDGLPVEFYQTFWTTLGDWLLDICNAVPEEGIPRSAKYSIISLIEKAGKNLDWLTNWRPLSLMDCDGKIYSKMIAKRLDKVTPKLIHRDQTGFMAGRSASDNILDLLSAVDWANKENKPMLIVSFDFEKAFDKLNWDYLDSALEFFNFGDKFRKMIRKIHEDAEACTINGGFSGKRFKVKNGLRQGSPISPTLFNLAVEIIGLKIRQNKEIVGIKTSNEEEEKKHGQYADDLWAIIHATQESFDALMGTFQDFAKISGLVINYNKTEILRIGSMQDSDAQLYTTRPLKWSTDITVLGIVITAKRREMIKINYERLYDKMNKILDPWRARSLSLIGKIQVINGLVASTAVYKMLCICTPTQEWLKKIKTLFTKFLWDGKKALIAYNTLVKSIEKGGLKLIDMESKNLALKTMWCNRVLSNDNYFWKRVASDILPMPIDIMLESRLNDTDINKILDANMETVAGTILKTWNKVKSKIEGKKSKRE